MVDTPRTKKPRRPRKPKAPPPLPVPLPAPTPNGHAAAAELPYCPWMTADRVVRQPIDWIIPGMVPRDRCTAVVGESGAGKSTLYSDLIAAHTTGSAPARYGEGAARHVVGRAILYSPEGADSEETIGRLRVAGADVGRVVLGDLSPAGGRLPGMRLPDDLDLMRRRWVESRVSLVVLDPIISYLAPGVSPHDSQGVRALLEALEECAQVYGITIIYTCHLRKSREGSPLDWIAGAAAWHQVPRHVVAMGRDPGDLTRRVILACKHSATAGCQSRLYQIEDVGGFGHIVLGGPCQVSPEDLGRAVAEDYERDALVEARAYLIDQLGEEERRTKDLIAAGKVMGISDRTMRRAKVQLGVTHHHVGRQPDRHVVWRRPEVWPER